VLDLEGLALNGFVETAKLEECKEGSTFKIIATLHNGQVVETECIERERISRTFIVITRYREWGKILAERGYTEEMMKGITYDLDHKSS